VSGPEAAAEPGSWVHTGLAQRIHFGPGSVAGIAPVLRDTGARRWLLVTTEGRLASEDGERLVRLLGRSLESTFAGVVSHVPIPAVQAAVAQARRDGVDGIVSFGGGSAADLGKAVCFLLEQESGTPGASYVDRPAIAHVSVPTTYSGAEVTPFFGMTDPAARAKTGAGGPTLAPLAVVYDPELTRATPPAVSAATGMNAIAHGVEAAWSPSRTPEAEAVALACVTRMAAALPAVVDDPDDLEARTDALAGAALGGRCLQNARMGVHHGLAQLVGGRTGVPHGLANAAILASAIRFNAEVVPEAVHRIGTALGDPDDPAGAVDRLVERLGLPARLGALGVSDADLDAVARLSQSSPSIAANPRPVGEADARAILADAS
jgi:maleylacetate reductase